MLKKINGKLIGGKVYTSVLLDPEVREYLDSLAHQAQRSRSWVLNAITRHHSQLVKEKKDGEKFPDPAREVLQLINA